MISRKHRQQRRYSEPDAGGETSIINNGANLVKSSSQYGAGRFDEKMDQNMTKTIVAKNHYKQSKLPRWLIGRQNNPELNFLLDQHFNTLYTSTPPGSDKNKQYHFMLQFNLKSEHKRTINLYCHSTIVRHLNIEDTHIKSPYMNLEKADREVWHAILKSHLQKTIRRGLTKQALATTELMLQECPLKLIRRLPIIVIEDVTLNTHFSTLVWLMIYMSDRIRSDTTRYHIPTKIRNLIMSQVAHLCREKYYDKITYQPDYQVALQKINTKLFGVEEYMGSNVIWNQIISLQLRKLYGGMNGDMVMIDQYCLVWFERVGRDKNEGGSIMKTPVLYEYDGVYELTKENFILDAIDFHPCPWILGDLRRSCGMEFDEIKESMWNNYSSFNFRSDNESGESSSSETPKYRDKWMEMAQGILNKYIL